MYDVEPIHKRVENINTLRQEKLELARKQLEEQRTQEVQPKPNINKRSQSLQRGIDVLQQWVSVRVCCCFIVSCAHS